MTIDFWFQTFFGRLHNFSRFRYIVVSLQGQILLEHEVQFYSSFIIAQNYIVHRQSNMYLYIFWKKCALPSDFMMKVTPSYQVSHSFPGSLLHWKSGEVYQSNNEINFLKKYIYIFLSCLCVFKSPQNGIVISLASIKKIWLLIVKLPQPEALSFCFCTVHDICWLNTTQAISVVQNV